MIDLAAVDFKGGLIPAVIRDARTGATLMVAWMNDEALRRTVESGETWFWSRSRSELWHKGATSGNRQHVTAMRLDCDRDTLLVDVLADGPACHTGAWSCFGDPFTDRLELGPLMSVLRQRNADRPEGSYAAKLFEGGVDRILKKIGEESSEVIIAVKGEPRERIVAELADLLFHLSVLLVQQGIDWADVGAELERRSEGRKQKAESRMKRE